LETKREEKGEIYIGIKKRRERRNLHWNKKEKRHKKVTKIIS
jgi:hypothetical protein